MSAPCIYHDDQPSVTLCPGCDFGVCQRCMDEGIDGVCSTCAEERAFRRETSAVQREYEAAEAVVRCNYCRVASDESTPLDEHGYCEACQALPRCQTHADLVAVGHCKGCRQEYCRKCLGFTDVCQDCTAKQKVKPKAKKPEGATSAAKAGAKAGAKPAGARKKTAPLGAEPAAPAGKRKKPGATARLSAEGEEEPKKKKKPTRGEIALKEKLDAKAAGKGRMQIIIVSVVGALVTLVLLSGMMLRAMSPEEQSKRIQEDMVTVHRAVIHYKKVVGQLPKAPEDVYRAMASMKVKGYKRIKVGTSPEATPGGVVYSLTKNGGFMVTGSDHQGQSLLSGSGVILYLDETFQPPP